MSGYDIVAIGASWGGLHAIGTVLEGLGPGFGAPVVVAQHRSPSDDQGLLPELLARRSGLPVVDGEDKGPLIPGQVIVAPAGYHMLVEDACVEVSCDDLVQFSRPSIDVLFESVAEEFGSRAIGVVLTGANEDGARGLTEIARRGGYTVVQDPATSERPEMPRAALAALEPDAVLALENIAGHLAGLVPEVV
ncbi:MAG TPA: chemotaxis protein CheB [Solirubrobacteraceae bacterium]|jgi:two-component system chemotaxis response regulator CheB